MIKDLKKIKKEILFAVGAICMLAVIYFGYRIITNKNLPKAEEVKLVEQTDNEVMGVVIFNEGEKFAISKDDGNEEMINVTKGTIWQVRDINSNQYVVTERVNVIEGDRVWVMSKKGGTGMLEAIAIKKEAVQTVAGKVAQIEGQSIKIIDFLGQGYQANVDGNTKIVEKPTARELKFEDIKVDDNVSIYYLQEGQNLKAEKIEVLLR